MKPIEEIKSYLNGAIQNGTDEVATFAARMLNWINTDTNPIEPQHTLFYEDEEMMNKIARYVEIVDAREPSWKVKEFWFDSDNNVMMVNFEERCEE